MFSRIGIAISAGFRKTAPDPFVLAILLTALTIGLAIWLTESSATDLVDYWAGSAPAGNAGIWTLLAFGMQMCLILVTGHALASSPPVAALLRGLSSLPRTGPQAAALVAAIAAGLGVLNWGLGLIAGALVARQVGIVMAKRGVPVHYPLLAAAGYVGLLVWHGGFSGSAPLKVTTTAQINDIFGSDPPIDSIPLTDTILSPMNLVITGGLLIIAPLLMAMLTPKDTSVIEPIDRFTSIDDKSGSHDDDDETADVPVRESESKPLLPRLLEDTPIVSLVLVALVGWWAWTYYFPEEGSSGITALTPDTVNLTMLMLGLLLHGTPMRYANAISDAARACAGIILQFPLYAGIMQVMKYSGLTALLAEQITASTNETTLPLATFASAGLVNLFVPSGGGQWAVQGPIAMQAAVDAGVSPAKMVMAVSYGDQLTNMLQPFWALPLLAITGCKARDIVGYTALLMLIAAAWIVLWLLIF